MNSVTSTRRVQYRLEQLWHGHATAAQALAHPPDRRRLVLEIELAGRLFPQFLEGDIPHQVAPDPEPADHRDHTGNVLQVLRKHRVQPGLLEFHRDVALLLTKARAMHLRRRREREGDVFKDVEIAIDRRPEFRFEQPPRFVGREAILPGLQRGQFLADFARENIDPQRQQVPGVRPQTAQLLEQRAQPDAKAPPCQLAGHPLAERPRTETEEGAADLETAGRGGRHRRPDSDRGAHVAAWKPGGSERRIDHAPEVSGN